MTIETPKKGAEQIQSRGRHARVDIALETADRESAATTLENWGAERREDYEENIKLVKEFDVNSSKETNEPAAAAIVFVAGFGVLGSYLAELAGQFKNADGRYRVEDILAAADQSRAGLKDLTRALPILHTAKYDPLETAVLEKMTEVSLNSHTHAYYEYMCAFVETSPEQSIVQAAVAQ